MARDPDLDNVEDFDDDETDGQGTEVAEGDAEGHEDEAGGGDGQEVDLTGQGDAGQGEGRQSQVRRGGRASERIRALTEERQKDREELAATKGRLEALERQSQQVSTQQQREEEQQRLALMSPDERMEYRLHQMQQQTTRVLNDTRAQMADATDRANYNALATVNPLYRKHADAVESIVREHQGRGFSLPREVALKNILGDLMLKNAGAARTRANNKGAQQRQQQTVRSGGGGRGDVGSDRGRTGGKSAKDRLEGVTF
jgi:hypothetical protein